MLDGDFDIDLGCFDVDLDLKFDEEDELKTRYIKPAYQPDRKEWQVKYKYAEEMAKGIEIEKNCRIYAIVSGAFIFGDFIEALIIEKNWNVKEMTISTLSMSDNNVDSLKLLIDHNYVEKLNLIISAYFFSHERGDMIPYIYKQLDKGNKFQLAVSSSHCKLCCIKTDEGENITIHGSANLRSSDCLEQIMIEENEDLYDFNMEYQNAILEKYKTIKKEIRGAKLWESIQPKQKV
jgi:hypothetical protein